MFTSAGMRKNFPHVSVCRVVHAFKIEDRLQRVKTSNVTAENSYILMSVIFFILTGGT